MKTFRVSEGVVVAVMSLGTLLATATMWRSAAMLSLVLAGLHTASLALMRQKKYIAVYTVGFLAGPITEAICIYFGAWSYNTPHFFGVPIWLGMVWGAAGVFFAHLSRTLSHGK